MMENAQMQSPFRELRSIGTDFEQRIIKLIEKHHAWFMDLASKLDGQFASDLENTRELFIGNWEWQDEGEKDQELDTLYESIRKLKQTSEHLVEFYQSGGMKSDEKIQREWCDVIDDTFKRVEELRGEKVAAKGVNQTKTLLVPGLYEVNCYWWAQVNSWPSDLPEGEVYLLPSHSASGGESRIFENYFKATLSDLVIIYEGAPESQVRAIGKVTKAATNRHGDTLHVEILHVLEAVVSGNMLSSLPHFSKSAVLQSEGTLFQLSQLEFEEVTHQAGVQLIESEDGQVFNDAYRTVIDNDTSSTDDLLSFSKDINSFATLLSMRDTKPPLAIALFGQWGSGKSFFMGRLMTAIRNLSNNQGFSANGVARTPEPEPGKEIFCRGIVQIEFNAWSYLDSNLWAGLVSTIFEKLDEYIDRNASDDEKEAVRSELNQKLQIVSDQKQAILKEKQDLEQQQTQLKEEIEKKKESKDKILEAIKGQTFKDIKESAMKEAKPIVDQVSGKLAEFGITNDRVNALSPDALYDEVRSWVTFAKNILKFKWWHTLIFILGLAGVMYLVFDPGDHLKAKLHAIEKVVLLLVTAFGPIVAKFIDSFHKYKQVFVPVLAYKNTFNERVKSAEYDHQNDLQLLEAELTQKDTQLAGLKAKLDAVDIEVKNVEFSLSNSITKQAFFNFIAKRSGDGVYEKHLGLISTIRRDFQTMTDLFIGANDERRRPTESAQRSNLKEVTPLETSEFRKRFEKPLDRIVLYIDDLDRCTDEKVIDVLQAVHLLMAYRLFIVVVGVDKRCVQNALIYRNLLQYSQFCKNNDMEFLSNMGISIIKPSEYLEKIFQIPFHLDEPGIGNIKYMIGELLRKQVQHADNGLNQASSNENSATHVTFANNLPAMEVITKKTTESEKKESPVYIAPEQLQLSEVELTCLQEFAWMIGSNPRNVKRYINIYKIIRAHELLTYHKDQMEISFLKVMFILAFNIGRHSDLVEMFYNSCRVNGNMTVATFLESDPRLGSVIQMFREGKSISRLLSLRIREFVPYLTFVKRFSFTMQELALKQAKSSEKLAQTLSAVFDPGDSVFESRA